MNKCVQCGATFTRKTHDPIDRFARRKYCSHRCSQRATCLQGNTKLCPKCGMNFGEKMSPAQFRRAKFCSKHCANKSRPVNPLTTRYATRTDKDGRCRAEHRVVVEEMLGRPLASEEHVHHINGLKTDNHPDNLQLISASEHARHHLVERYARGERLR